MIIPDLIQPLKIQENLMVLSQDYKSIFEAWIRETSLYWMPTSHHVHDTILEHVMDDFFDGATTSPCSIQKLCLG